MRHATSCLIGTLVVREQLGGEALGPTPLLTLPQLAEAVDVEYRTLHSWLKRGLIEPSMQRSRGTGIPNLFSRDDAVKAKVIADLRQAGLSLEILGETLSKLNAHSTALTDGAMVLVNGNVAVVDAGQAAGAIEEASLTLVYNVRHAMAAIDASLEKQPGSPAPPSPSQTAWQASQDGSTQIASLKRASLPSRSRIT